METVFLANEKSLFHLSDIPGSERVSPKRKTFLKNFSFRLVEMNYLPSRNIVLFRALLNILKFGGSSLFRTNLISARGN